MDIDKFVQDWREQNNTEDAVKLRELNQMIEGEYDCLSCFV